MFSSTDFDKLQQIMEESPEKKELLSRLLTSHQMTVSAISHEIRNPLTLVYSTLQLIESQHPEVQEFHHWADMRNDILYMKLLLEELSAYNNSDRLSISEIDMNTFFKKICLSFATSLIETDIEFISRIDTALPLVSGDAVKLQEVFLNLLGNARDSLALLPEHKKGVIHFFVSFDHDMLTITIKDNGRGIDHEQLPHIFEPFVTYKKNGTGLGLPLSLKIIKTHKGTINVSSIPHVLTTFTVTLPIKKNT